MLNNTDQPVANPTIVYREEFDDWAILFDPDTNETYGLDPVSSFIWKHMDGKHSVDDILAVLQDACEDGIPPEAPEDLAAFFNDLAERGLIGYIQEPAAG